MSGTQRLPLVLAVLVALLGGLAAENANSQPTSRPTSRPARAPWAPRTDCSGVYGLPVKTKLLNISLADLMKEPGKYAGKRLEIQGVVQDVCRKKGCWMLVKSGKHVMRVRFAGYKFFVPTNSKGYKVSVYGLAKETVIPEKLARHYAEESGDPQKAKTIKGPQKTVVFTADWVVLSK